MSKKQFPRKKSRKTSLFPAEGGKYKFSQHGEGSMLLTKG
jgi:hypothetical protein